jgi:hypothetical protein
MTKIVLWSVQDETRTGACCMRDEADLLRDGWVRQTTYDEPRLSEMVEAYRELGKEVHLEPFSPGAGPGGCSVCLDALPDRFFTIYTRSTPEGGTKEG